MNTLGLLGVLFIALKLTHVIAWSWWWVLAPFYGPLALVLCAMIAWLAAYLGLTALSAWLSKRK